MIISDLNTLEVVDGSAVVGGFASFWAYGNASYNVNTKVGGNVATSTSDAYAYGKNTATETDTSTYVSQGYSSSSHGQSISAASY